MSSKNIPSTNCNRKDNGVTHSDPIPIITSPFRRRSASISSSSSGSASSASEITTPLSLSGSGASQRTNIPSPGSSPILSYFLAQSPTKTAPTMTYPFKHKFGPPPVFEEPEQAQEVPVAAHARRASTVVAGRFAQPLNTSLPETHQERGTGLLRRLSFSSTAFARPVPENQRSPVPTLPTPPPNTAVNPTPTGRPFSQHDGKPRRAATLSAERPRRAPSPMGERILKGHFDGFN